jgi:hypothetical protein
MRILLDELRRVLAIDVDCFTEIGFEHKYLAERSSGSLSVLVTTFTKTLTTSLEDGFRLLIEDEDVLGASTCGTWTRSPTRLSRRNGAG